MRLVIQRHDITTHCERCLPSVLEMSRDCFHVLELVDDGLPENILVIRSEQGDETYTLTPQQIELMKTDGAEAILAEIKASSQALG